MHFPKVTVVFGAPIYLEDFDFLPKEDRLDAVSWYAMRECYALRDNVNREEVDMKSLFPEARDFSTELAGKMLSAPDCLAFVRLDDNALNCEHGMPPNGELPVSLYDPMTMLGHLPCQPRRMCPWK